MVVEGSVGGLQAVLEDCKGGWQVVVVETVKTGTQLAGRWLLVGCKWGQSDKSGRGELQKDCNGWKR